MSAYDPRLGPPTPPRCPYCDDGRVAGVGPGYRAGCPKHDPKMRASLEDDIYETALLGLVHIDADEVIDVRWLMPHPDHVPTDVETVMTMGEFRARVVNVRGLLAAESEDSE